MTKAQIAEAVRESGAGGSFSPDGKRRMWQRLQRVSWRIPVGSRPCFGRPWLQTLRRMPNGTRRPRDQAPGGGRAPPLAAVATTGFPCYPLLEGAPISATTTDVLDDSASLHRKMDAEIARLIAESGKLNAENGKLQAETSKLNRELRFFPWLPLATVVLGSTGVIGLLSGVAALIIALHK